MIQDIFPKKLHNEYQNIGPKEGDFVVYVNEGRLLLGFSENDRTLTFPVFAKKDAADDTDRNPDHIYLFSVDDERYFLALNKSDTDGKYDEESLARNETGSSYKYDHYSLRDIRALNSPSDDKVFAAYTAFHLWKWYNDNKFCGRCAAPLLPDGFGKKESAERALVCPSCGNRIYPRINPAVIIALVNGDRIVLTRYRRGYAHNALIAGFTEIGETLEQTVEREVMEEVGLRVKNIRYYKSQPWGMAEDILAGFVCELDGDDTIKMDESELKYAEWVDRKKVELQPSDYSLTNEMMKMFRDGLI